MDGLVLLYCCSFSPSFCLLPSFFLSGFFLVSFVQSSIFPSFFSCCVAKKIQNKKPKKIYYSLLLFCFPFRVAFVFSFLFSFLPSFLPSILAHWCGAGTGQRAKLIHVVMVHLFWPSRNRGQEEGKGPGGGNSLCRTDLSPVRFSVV